MYRLAIIIILTSFSLFANGQKTVISGLVKDKANGEPLIGANIVISSTGRGTSTDVYGFYSLEVTDLNSAQIKASFVGYKPFQEDIELNGDLRLDILLEPGVEIGGVEVIAGKPIEERLELGAVEIPVAQVKNMPMFGEPDVLKAMQLLPGVQGGSDGRSGLYVRGGSPDQNLFMLDGTPLYYVNHLGGFVSVFHPGILKNIKLYKGGFPARFGGRLSSVIDLRMKEGDKKKFHGSYGVGIISGDLTLEGPIVKDKTSFIVSVRRVWIDLLMRPVTKLAFKYSSMGYNFYDFYGKISHEADAANRFYFTLYGGDDRLGFFTHIREDKIRGRAKYIWGNVLSTLRWNRIYTPKLNSDITLFYTRYRYKNTRSYKTEDTKGRNLYSTGVHDLGIKADYNWHLTKNYKLRFGGGISNNWFIPGQISYRDSDSRQKTDTVVGSQNRTRALNTFIYVENEISPFRWWSANVGVRLVNFRVGGKNYFSTEPRFISNVKLKNFGSLKLGYTQMMQPVHMLTYSGSTFPTDIWLPATPGIPPGVSTQYSIGYSRSIKKGKYELSIEAYTKKMRHLIEIKGGIPLVNTRSWGQNVEKGGVGRSKGIEFFLQKKQGRTTGWVSYTLSKSDRRFENINQGRAYAFKYDRRHDFSIVISHKLSEKVDFSATWVYGSGYPITLHNGIYLATEPGSWDIESPNADFFKVAGEAYLYPGKNWLRMRDYHRLDLGVNFKKERLSKRGKKQTRTWTIGVYNAYNRQNAVFYYFGHKGQDPNQPIVLYQQSGFPVIPSVKYSVKF
ncbi:TonB-dependent receptor [hydrothermal vent metagenome]|uniref:TonB-dependent receptor n=1 Tax=hydrothermal vent metagenome TaxID=652676 RepID=A0A3B0U3X5_9ZZZZ